MTTDKQKHRNDWATTDKVGETMLTMDSRKVDTSALVGCLQLIVNDDNVDATVNYDKLIGNVFDIFKEALEQEGLPLCAAFCEPEYRQNA